MFRHDFAHMPKDTRKGQYVCAHYQQLLTNIYEYTIIYTVATFPKKKEAQKLNPVIKQEAMELKVVKVIVVLLIILALSTATASAASERPDFSHPTREAQNWANKNTQAPIEIYLSLIGIGIASGIIAVYRHKKK